MTIVSPTLRHHARICGLTECCTNASLAAHAFSCSLDDARAALKLLADTGYLRATLLPGLGNKIIYQPTSHANPTCGAVPKFLRAGSSADARLRGLLRGFVRFVARPELSYLPAINEQSALCVKYGIPERGHARALVGVDGAHSHIFVPLLPTEKPTAAIETAAFRWLPLLDTGTATLHFVAPTGEAADAVRAALATLAPSPPDLTAELERIADEIAADRTGLAALRLASQRASLLAEVEEAGQRTHEPQYPWLGSVVEATL